MHLLITLLICFTLLSCSTDSEPQNSDDVQQESEQPNEDATTTGAETPAPKDEEPPASPVYPSDISNQFITMQVDSGDLSALQSVVPDVHSEIRFRTLYSDHPSDSLHFYLQHPDYLGWQYEGEYSIEHTAPNILTIDAYLTEQTLEFELLLTFSDQTSGQWQMLTSEQTITGTFTLAPTQPLTEYTLKGSVETELQITSTHADYNYIYHVYLPENYESTNRDYPLVLKTDGNYGFEEFSKLLELNQTDAIFIALEQGAENRREIDFREPGVSAYLDFYQYELLPHLQSLYRIDDNQRTLFGHSYGGLLVRSAMIRDKHQLNEHRPRLFANYIAADGAYWYQNDVYLQQENTVYAIDTPFEGMFFLAGANLQGLAAQVDNYKNTLINRHIQGLNIHHENYNMNHNQVIHPVFRKGISLIFPR